MLLHTHTKACHIKKKTFPLKNISHKVPFCYQLYLFFLIIILTWESLKSSFEVGLCGIVNHPLQNSIGKGTFFTSL